MTTDIARLRELMAKATPGPWDTDTGGEIHAYGGGVATTFEDALIFRTAQECLDNALLIVGAVNALPAILTELETLRAKVAAMGWQPMETAPRDYKVLVYNQATGPYFSRAEGNEWPMHSWDDQNGVWYPQPTHWQPLPAPPARTALAKPDAAS